MAADDDRRRYPKLTAALKWWDNDDETKWRGVRCGGKRAAAVTAG
jgi:hypothetical protein